MRHLLTTMAVLAFVTPLLMAAPINFSENWDGAGMASGSPPGAPWGPDPHMTAGRANLSTLNAPHSAPLAYRVTDASYGGGNGATRGDQAMVVGAGQSVEATDAAPLSLNYWEKGQKFRYTDFFVELSLGDVHAPAFTLSPLAETIPVIGFGKPYIETVVGYGQPYSKWLSFFDGKQWRNPGCLLTQDATWEQLLMTITSSQVTLDTSKHADATDIAYTLARQYTGAFDRITIYTRWDNISGYYTMVDDLVLSGGDVVPEPAALALLAFGCLWTRRRRRSV